MVPTCATRPSSITATLSPTLVDEFGLQARELGLLAGGYFLGFSATQLPMGHWLDRHGPKRVLMSFLLVAVVGSAAFALATGFSGQILRLNADGQPVAMMGQPGPGPALGDFGEAHYMAIAPGGDIFVADTINAKLHRFAK